MASPVERNQAASGQVQNRRYALLVGLSVAGGFLILASAWFFLIRAAREANVESVPLATPGGKP